METLQARREWEKIFQVMRTRGLQLTLLYPARLSIRIEGQIRSFPEKRSLKEYISTKPAPQEMLEKTKTTMQNNKKKKESKKMRIV